MIAKRVQRRSDDDYGRLARYIAAAGDEGEKLDALWMVNCDAGDGPEDLEIAIIEIEATQARNSRATGDRTYHLILSFRNDRPDDAALRRIEWQFAAALGYGQHQRVAATHVNTDNFHMHIAINRVHPETGRCVTPFRDFEALEATCRAVERQYGLSIDNGRAETRERPAGNAPAQDMERHTWEQSFTSWVQGHKGELKAALEEARDWQDLHHAFDRLNLGLKPSGAGLVIHDLDGDFRMNASALGRQFSKAALEDRFGAFTPMKGAKADRRRTAGRRYRRRPLTTHPDTPKLWRRWLRRQRMQTARHRKDSLVRRLAGSWKDFLMTEAIHDPLALAILMMQKQLLGAITPANRASPHPHLPRPRDRATSPTRRPVSLDDRFWLSVPFADKIEAGQAGASFDRRRKAWWVEKFELDGRFVKWMKDGRMPVAEEDRVWLVVPYTDRAAAKAAGALWDRKHKAWYRHADMEPEPFAAWQGDGGPPPKPAERIYIEVSWREREAARDAGARWDRKQASWYYTADMDRQTFAQWRERAPEARPEGPSVRR